MDIFNYDTSFLNPALKLFNVALFLVVAFIYFRARRFYAGDILKVLNLLFWMSFAGALGALLRYFGHGEMFGFNSKFSLKWFQSLCYIAQGTLLILAAWRLSKGVVPEIRGD
jgi:hypothetical protein